MKVLGNRILIENIEMEKNSVLDLISDTNQPLKGKVLSKGEQALEVNLGDFVLYNESDVQTISYENKKYLILRDHDIIAIL